MFDKAKKKIEDKGINPLDVVKVLATFKVLNFAIYGGMIALCYKKHPLIGLSNRYQLEKKLATQFPKVYARGTEFAARQITKLSQNTMYRKAVTKFNLSPTNLTKSTVEASIMFKLLIPVVFPLSFYTSVKMFKKSDK
jgi:hypothetical protein